MRALLLASLLLACSRPMPGGLAPSGVDDPGAGGAPIPSDPCAGAAIDAWGFCVAPDGSRVDPSCCPEPEPRPCRERVLRGCELDGLCRWLVPGCEEPALPEEGCYPIADCTEGECGGGLECRTVVVDPCAGKRCGMCAAPAAVCLPPACEDGAEVRDGACLGPGGAALPPACCTWSCRAGGLFCQVEPPRCPPGEVPAVVGGCWGPCVPVGRCREAGEERLCRSTGGTWELECGHATCGLTPSCVDPRPSCRCGPMQVFDPVEGCTEADLCLCHHTGGIWDTGGCGHADCGEGRSCAPPVPGCVCPITSVFVAGAGCEVSDACDGR